MFRRYLFTVLLITSPVLADESKKIAGEAKIDREAAELFDSVMSPYCPGRTLSACPSDKARELREELRESLAKGEDPAKLKDNVLKQFGDLSGKPTGKVSSNLAYIGVIIFFVLGFIVVFLNIQCGGKRGGKNVEEEG